LIIFKEMQDALKDAKNNLIFLCMWYDHPLKRSGVYKFINNIDVELG